MILAKDDIEKAVSWWAGKLMDHQPHSNGDDSFTSVAVCFLADTMRQSVTLDQLNTFKAALAKSIEEYAKSIQAFGFSIGSDYGRAKLADAARPKRHRQSKLSVQDDNVFYGKRGGSGTGWLRCPGCQDLLR